MARGGPRTLASGQCLRRLNPSIAPRSRSYNISKLSPLQPPPQTTPSSPHFVPSKMGGTTTRLTTYYNELVAPNFLIMRYDPSSKWKQQQLPLRWDGTSPYHKNRPQPRDRQLPRVVQPVTARNIPQVESITIHTMVKSSIGQRPDLLNAAVAVQSITGQRPEFVHSYTSVAVFRLRPRTPSGWRLG